MTGAGRPEVPLDPSAGPLAEFAHELRGLRQRKGFTYRQLADATGLAVSTLRTAGSGTQIPTWRVTSAIVGACDGEEQRIRILWERALTAAGRPVPDQERVIPDTAPPDPGMAITPAQFIDLMKQLRAWAGAPSLAVLNQRSGGYLLPPSTVSETLRRDRLPRLELVSAFARACGLPDEHVERWEQSWASLRSRELIPGTAGAQPSPALSLGTTDNHPSDGQPNMVRIGVGVTGLIIFLILWLAGLHNPWLTVGAVLMCLLVVWGQPWLTSVTKGGPTFVGFSRRYRRFVAAGLRFTDIKGLATVGPFTPESDEVFIDIGLTRRAPHQVSAGLLGSDPLDVTERLSLSKLINSGDPVTVALIGGPGTGKTTLMRQVARQMAQGGHARRTVPILLYLRDHASRISASPELTLPEVLRSTLGSMRSQEPPGWFEGQLRAGRCVVLLDGLDEVVHAVQGRAVADWIERQIAQYPGNDYVVTSRPLGYRSNPITAANVMQTRGLSEEQVARFIHSWYLAVEKHSTGMDGQEVRLRARSESDDLLRRLRSAPALHDLTVSPLLLTMIANVHRYRGALPGSRTGLYAEICQVMLWRRQEAKNLTAQLPGEKKEAVLRALAYAMMQRRLSDLPREDVLAEIGPALPRLGRQVNAEDFLADTGGLLVERERGQYCFAHHTFQEYLAAVHIRDKGLVDGLAKTVGDPWWRETTLLYTAQADADPIVTACLDSGTIPALTLAFDCADQDSDLGADLRRQLDELLAAATDPATNPQRRDLMASVMATRHLRAIVQLADGGRVCARPVTTIMYRLFAERMEPTKGHLQSSHTGAEESPVTEVSGQYAVAFNTGAEESPVTGVSGQYAVAFTKWLNDLLGEPACRLPTRSEINNPAVSPILQVQAPGLCVWVDSGSVHDLELWPVPTESSTQFAECDIDRATLVLALQ